MGEIISVELVLKTARRRKVKKKVAFYQRVWYNFYFKWRCLC